MTDRELRIRMLLEAADKITKPMREAAGGSLKLAAAMKETRGRMKELQSQTAKIESFRTLKSGLAETTTQLATARTRTTELGRALAATAKPTKEMTRQFNAAKREVTDLEARQAQQHGSLTRLRSALSAAGVSTKELASHERRLKAEVAATTAELTAQQKSLSLQQRFAAARERFSAVQGTATGLAAGGASAMVTGRTVARPLIEAAGAAMGMEESMADVAKVTGMVGAGLKLAQQGFTGLSEEIPMAAAELAAIGASGAQAGVGVDKAGNAMKDQRQQLLAFTRDAGQMGTAFDMAAEEAGKTMAAWRQGFGLTGEGARELGDQINALTDNFGGVAAEVAAVLTTVGPLGDIAKTSAGSMAALAASMNAAGIAPEVAATGIKNMLLSLTAGTAATARQQKAFKALGLSATDTAKRMQIDSRGTILDVLERLRGMSGEKQTATLSLLFGKEVVTAIAPLLANMDGLLSRMNLVGDASRYAGSMMREFQNRSGTATVQTTLATNGVNNLKIALGNGLLPLIKAGARRLLGWTQGLRAWAEAHPNISKMLGITLGIVAGLFVVLGGLALVIAGLVTPFAVLAGAASLLGIGFLPLTGIVFGVVAGVAALVAVGYGIYKAWGPISGFFTGMWQEIKTGFSGGIGSIAATLLNFSPVGLLYRNVSALLGWLGVDIPARMSDVGKLMIKGLISGLKAMWGGLKSTISGIGSTAITALREKLGIHSPSRVFATLGGHMMAGLDVGLARGSPGPLSRLTDLSTRLSGALVAGGSAVALSAAPVAATPPAPVTYHITINAPSGNGPDIAAAVRQAIADMERQHRARRFGDD